MVDPTKYLAVPEDTTSSQVTLMTVVDSAVPERCLWRATLSAQSGCIVTSLYNSRYLYCNGTGVFTSPDLGTVGSTAYDTRVWRIMSTSYYNGGGYYDYLELGPYSRFSDCEVEIGQTGSFDIIKCFDNEIWCDPSNDFIYSVSQPERITVTNSNFVGIKRGIITVTATHKVTNRIIDFSVYIKNTVLTSSEQTHLQEAFVELIAEENFSISDLDASDISAAITILIANDATITEYCNEYRIPKEFVQSVLFKEICCYNLADTIADEAVEAYYDWKVNGGIKPIVVKTDCSTGLGQIFASTAISALNHAHERNINRLDSMYDPDDWHDIWEVWEKLHNDDTFNIQCCALVILDCQYEYSTTIPYEAFFDCTEAQIKTILARYNGTGDAAIEYGNICYEYFEIFKNEND